MKKVLLLIMLCPLMALSQGNLVTWNSTSQPTGLTNLTAQAISGGGGVTVGQPGWAGGFQVENLHWGNTSTAINTSKYVEFRANPNSGYEIKPTEFVLITRWANAQSRKMEVRASINGSTWTSLTNSGNQTVFDVTGSNQTFTVRFPSGYTVATAQTLTIRVYYYDFSNNYYTDTRIINTESGSSTPGPTLRGTVTPEGGVMANNDTATTVTGYPTTINVLNNDTATNTTISAVNVISQPANGTAAVQGNNIVYTPNAGFAGTNSFQYRITGADNSTSTATVTVTVGAMIQPVANNDSTTTDRNVAKTINVLGNDAIGSGAVTSVNVTTSAQHGTTVVNGDRTITYTPATGYTGPDSFRYTLTDQYNNTATATVTLSVLKPLNVPLEGTYYVGTNGEFTTITAAVANLNQYGVSGPVKFLLTNTSYTSTTESFPIIINPITGNSVTNTVTFKPAPSTSVNIQVNDITVSYNNYQAIAAFVINSGNVIFDGSNTATGTTRNLTVNNNNSISSLHRTVFWIGSNTSRITIKNTNIRMGVKNQGERFCTGVYMGDYQITGSLNSRQMVLAEATGPISNVNVVNNDFMNVKQGIYVNGGTGTANAINIVIHQNDLGSENNLETIIQPAALNNVNGFDYTENLIYNLYRDNDAGNLISSGVYVTGASKNGNIMRNNMRDLTRTAGTGSAFAGVALNSSDNDSNIVVANNFILNVVAVASGQPNQNGHGIFVMTGGGYKIYHNTVSLTANPTGAGYSAALYVGPTVTGLDVRNNILVNNQTNAGTRRCSILIDNTVGNINTVFTHLDYNNYYSTDRIGYIGGANHGVSNSNNPGYITTFSVWKSTTGKDTNTIEFNPVFASATDLHLTTGNGAIDNEGTPIPGITKDIDGQLRSTQHPTIGADEYGEPTPPAPGDNTGVYCETSTTWNGTEWSNGLPDASKDAIFSGNFTKTGGTLEACSMFVLANANVNFISNSNAVITHNVTVVTGGSLTFESGSNLVQIENTANSGKVTVKRNSSKLKRLDYTMWASPVAGQNLLAFSPVTMADRFYTYNTTTNQYNSIVPSANNFTAGKGYLIRMPNSNAAPGYNARTAAIVFNGEFKGTPHNGNVRIPLNYNSDTQSYNAVGNPYPSPINILDFLEANADNIDGTFYIWRKTNDHTILSSYWTCNKAGATANSAPGGGGSGGNDTNDLIFNPYKADPTGLLSTGQGFIVKAKSANKELVFRNNMRRTTNNSFILRNGNVNNGDAQEAAATANRIWLNVTNDADAFSQVLIAYMPQATEGYDDGYDGVSLMDGGVNLYTLQADNKLAIQSRPDFVNTDVVNLGFKTNVAGNFEIKIDHTDGIFDEGQVIYVKDNETNTVHNLQESSYSFTSEAGTFNSRFEIVYVPNGSLGTEKPVISSKDVLVYRDAKQVKVTAPQAITSVAVYDLTGKTIFEKNNIDAAEFTTADINAASQVVIVKVLLENGQAVVKKIMMN